MSLRDPLGMTQPVGPAAEGYGECAITRLHGSLIAPRTEMLRIDHADPRVLITPELLKSARCRDPEMDELMWAPGHGVTYTCPHDRPDPACPTGDVLRIDAGDRCVVYRIGKRLPVWDCYEAEWPD